MKVLIEQLKEQLEAALSETTNIDNKIERYLTATRIVSAFSGRVRERVLAQENPFPNRKVEMAYFRYAAPHFYSQLYYYKSFIVYYGRLLNILFKKILFQSAPYTCEPWEKTPIKNVLEPNELKYPPFLKVSSLVIK